MELHGERQPGIYFCYLVDRETGKGLDLDTFGRLLDDLDKYARGTDVHWEAQVNRAHPENK
jgi:hypothetical protein